MSKRRWWLLVVPLGVMTLACAAWTVSPYGGWELSDDDPRWATVVVESSIDEGWVNVVRYALFPIPE